MLISKVIRDAFQEFENHCSLVLFSKGCNFKCNNCYNYSAVTADEVVGPAIKVIDEYLTPFHDAIVFLGGEPTIWENQLIETLLYAKRRRRKIKIFTNGFKFEIIHKINLSGLVDAYSVDFKAVKNVSKVIGQEISDIEYLANVNSSILDIQKYEIPLEIRTTKWDTIENIDNVINYVREKYPDVVHILQEDFLKINERRLK